MDENSGRPELAARQLLFFCTFRFLGVHAHHIQSNFAMCVPLSAEKSHMRLLHALKAHTKLHRATWHRHLLLSFWGRG